jgi:hypothetical protein
VTAPKGHRCRQCGIRTIAGAWTCAACSYAEYVAVEGSLCGSALPVTCWCEESYAYVKPALIKAGVTRSCGRPDCGPERIAA